MRTKRVRSVAVAAVVAAGLALVVSACGSGGGSNETTTSATQGKTFPQLKVVWGTTDYMGLTRGVNARFEGEVLYKGKDLLTISDRDMTSIAL